MGDQKGASKSHTGFVDVYLLFYNIAQLLGWLGVFVLAARHLVATGGDYKDVFDSVETLLTGCQLSTFLEVIHAAAGLVRSSPMVTLFQWIGRDFALFAVTKSVPGARNHLGCLLMVMSWSFFDVIRYAMYASALLKRTPYLLLWARYTLFIPFYPIGFAGEMLQVYYAIPVVRELRLFSFSLPNAANFSFDFSYFLTFYLPAAIFAFFFMYKHMIGQRSKHLVGKEKAS